ncbi:hypothetical protein [uncultured Limosilactobacillus sp.]|uniref:hypothetical protein n=1 Tax=uncultured Limosilactobacillus sp. TaxID=2837629 RepID=UPI0025FB566C|nr:hypothetical protein [uncultured Limosilactobacillus sp.]
MMRVIKAMIYVATSSIATIAYREGNMSLMSAMFLIGDVFFGYDMAMYFTDNKYPIIRHIVDELFADGTKKGTSRH